MIKSKKGQFFLQQLYSFRFFHLVKCSFILFIVHSYELIIINQNHEFGFEFPKAVNLLP